jgi:phage minor structural protein
MLLLYDTNHNKIGALTNCKDYYIEQAVNIDDLLYFSYPIADPQYPLIAFECYVRNENNEYVIKEINAQGAKDGVEWAQFVCRVNLEDLKGYLLASFETIEQSPEESANLALAGTGWVVGYCDVTKLRTVRKAQCSVYDIMAEIVKAYACEINYDAVHKAVNIHQKQGADRGAYFAEQLNLQQLQSQSNTNDYITRLIPIGLNGLDITTINNDINYISNYQYSNKVLTGYWIDNRYTSNVDLVALNTALTTCQVDATAKDIWIGGITSDNKLTGAEKSDIGTEMAAITAELAVNDTQATTLEITTEKAAYDDAYNTLNAYIAPLIADTATETTIGGNECKEKFDFYYLARITLLTAFVDKAKVKIDVAAQTLKDDAAERLAYLSKPTRAYSASIVDLASVSGTWDLLDFALGDFITLLSESKNVRELQRIVKIDRYPEEPERSTIQIANRIARLEDIILRVIDAADTVATVTDTTGSVVASSVSGAVAATAGIDASQLAAISARVVTAQSTANGKNTVFYGPTTPTSPNVNDLWMKPVEGGIEPQIWDGTAWVSARDAVTNANATDIITLQTTANGRNTVFYGDTAPEFPQINDLWMKPVEGGIEPQIWTGVNWISCTDAVANAAKANAATAQATADGKNTAYYQTVQPTGGVYKANDIWYDTDDGYKMYYYNGTTWVSVFFGTNVFADNAITADKIADAVNTAISNAQARADLGVANAATSQTTANGKNKVYYQTTIPTGGTYILGDVWFDTDDGYKMYVHNGASFTASQFGTDAIANLSITNALIADGTILNAKISTLDAGKITAGYISVDRLQAGTIVAAKLATDTITAASGVIADLAIVTANIANLAVIGAKIANATIVNANIADATIQSAKIVALDAAKITTGTLDAARIAAGSITAIQIASKTITASQIAAGSITSASGVIGTLDAGAITTGTMSALRITSGTITATQMAVGTITAASGIIGSLDAGKITTGTLSGITLTGVTITAKDILNVGSSSGMAALQLTSNYGKVGKVYANDARGLNFDSTGGYWFTGGTINITGTISSAGEIITTGNIWSNTGICPFSKVSPQVVEFEENAANNILQITVAGGAGFGAATWASDRSLKDNIQDTAETALDKIMAIKHRKFDWKEEHGGKHSKIGYISQELMEIDDTMVVEIAQKDAEGNKKPSRYQPNETVIIPMLSKAIQELKAEIDALKLAILKAK